jgi:carbon storage regulator
LRKRYIRREVEVASCQKTLTKENKMLVLTRKIGETVHIDTGIIVTLLEVSGNRIRIGIDAPRQVPIMRGELLHAVAAHDQVYAPSEECEHAD